VTRSVEDLLSEPVGPAPPTAIDVDATIVRMRGTVRRRRAAAAVGVIAAVTAAVWGVAAVARPAGLAATAAAVSSGLVATSTPPPLESGPQIAARLTPVVVELMHETMPDASFVANRSDHPDTTAFELIASYPQDRELEAGADVTDDSGTGNVLLVMSDRGGAFTHCEAEFGSDCARSVGPHGETIVAFDDFLSDSAPGDVRRIDVTKPDGTSIVIFAEAWGVRGAVGKISPATRSGPPLTVAQMVRIAVDPRLTMDAPA
jgi:hypothetical protein